MAAYLLAQLVGYLASCTRARTEICSKQVKLVFRVTSTWTMKVLDWSEEILRYFCRLVMDAIFPDIGR